MERLASSPSATSDRSRPEGSQASPRDTDRDEELCGQLKDYLACLSRNLDPPSTLAESWDRFYAINTPRIWAFLRRCGLAAADREDCLQEVWGEVIVHLPDLPYDPKRGRLSTWLITVARNRAVDMIRRRRRLAEGMDDDAFAVVDSGPSPADDCERHSMQERVRSAVIELSEEVPPVSQVFYQRTIEERTTDEVADKLGLTAEQVRSRLHRTKQKFRDLFERFATSPARRRDASVGRRSEIANSRATRRAVVRITFSRSKLTHITTEKNGSVSHIKGNELSLPSVVRVRRKLRTGSGVLLYFPPGGEMDCCRQERVAIPFLSLVFAREETRSRSDPRTPRNPVLPENPLEIRSDPEHPLLGTWTVVARKGS